MTIRGNVGPSDDAEEYWNIVWYEGTLNPQTMLKNTEILCDTRTWQLVINASCEPLEPWRRKQNASWNVDKCFNTFHLTCINHVHFIQMTSQMQFRVYVVFQSHFSHPHVSAAVAAIFRMKLFQEYKNSFNNFSLKMAAISAETCEREKCD